MTNVSARRVKMCTYFGTYVKRTSYQGRNVRRYVWLRTLEFLSNDCTDLSLRHTG